MESPDRQLRYFVKIAELKSLSRAAEILDLTQSGISRQLSSLEAYVGKPLFLRTGRGVELTDAGKKLLMAAKPAYAGIDEALDTIRDREGVTQGHVRLAVIHTLSYYFMTDVVAEFISQRENVNLSLMGRSSPEVVSLVESGKADIGFVYDSAVDSADLKSTPLFEDEMCAMLKLVSSQVGICVLPSQIPEKLLVDYDLKKLPIAQPKLRRRVVAITRNDKHLPPLVRDLIKVALAKVR